MGAVSSCCAVEDAEDRQVLREGKGPENKTKAAAKEKKEAAPKKEQTTKKEVEQKDKKETKENQKEDKRIKKQHSTQSKETTTVVVEQEKVDDLKKRLEKGMRIVVLLQDATRLSCMLHLNPADNSLSISCEDKVRVIPLSDVKSLLHTRDQLKRVETKANLVDDENCVALHLLESGNCIPVRFEAAKDKQTFVELVKQLKSK